MILNSDRYRLGEVFNSESLRRAWKNVGAKASSPRIDGVSVTDFSRNVNHKLTSIHDSVIHGTYRPKPVITFLKDKSYGEKQRELTIATVRDRIASRTAADYPNYNYDSMLMPQSYAYRKN